MASDPRIFLITTLLLIGSGSASIEKSLIRHLLEKYKKLGKMGRPVDNVNDPMNVSYGMSVIQIMELDERKQVLVTNVWGNYKWKDSILVWNESDFGNISSVRVPVDKIWTPDIKLYNYADERLEELRDALVVVYSHGEVLYVPQAIYKSSCSIDITHFPFDIQSCKMKFGSWTYGGFALDLQFFFDNDTGLDFGSYIQSNEWEFVKNMSKKHTLKYECCEEPYIDLTFYFALKRKVAFYNYILILPCVLLSSLTLVLFWLPPESPAKMQLGMNIFVAFFVLLLLLAESTPPAASSIPLIGAYYCLNMVLITLSTCLSVIVVNIYFHGNHTRLPKWLKKLILTYLAPALFLTDFVKGITNAGAKIKPPIRTIYASDQNHESIPKPNEERWRLIANGSLVDRPGGKSSEDILQDYTTAPSSEYERLENDVREIKNALGFLMDKLSTKDSKAAIGNEWKIFAIVVDRIFFILYLICIIVSGMTIFGQTGKAQVDLEDLFVGE